MRLLIRILGLRGKRHVIREHKMLEAMKCCGIGY